MAPWILIAALLAQEAGADVTQQHKSSSAFFPLPLYTTVPNEGSTYGAMPVIIRIAPSGEIRWILAPSLSWNKAAGFNATFRYYRYPTPAESWSVIAAASTKVNRTLLVTYDRLPYQPRTITIELRGRAKRNLFYRFFGLGPDTTKEDESSYTRTSVAFTGRAGVNGPHHFNGGLRFTVRYDKPIEHAIFGLPELQQAHPDAPGLNGAAMVVVGASIRYDTRENGDYAGRGLALELAGGRAIGLKGFDHYWQGSAQARALWPETSFLQGAARLYFADEVGGHDIPFYYQSTLGGEVLLRGFPEDRFIDRGAWLAELEQRIRLFRLHMFHVASDWRLDPFVSAGQVFPRLEDLGRHPRVAGGLGLRTWVHPNIVGRVDLAYGGEGIRAYVVLGYPF
jgi:hypothetical protein